MEKLKRPGAMIGLAVCIVFLTACGGKGIKGSDAKAVCCLAGEQQQSG